MVYIGFYLTAIFATKARRTRRNLVKQRELRKIRIIVLDDKSSSYENPLTKVNSKNLLSFLKQPYSAFYGC